MNILLIALLAQGLPFPGPGIIHSTGVTRQNNTFQTGGTNCGNGGGGCQVASAIIGTTGDAGVIVYQFCGDVSCSLTGCNATASDGTNTWTSVPAASIIAGTGSIGYMLTLVAKNATAGTYIITVSVTGAGCVNFFGTVYFWDAKGANHITPVDSSVSNAAQGTSASPSLTSAGNITNVNEVAYCVEATANAWTTAGSFSTLDTVAATAHSLDLVHPSSGATVTCNGTQSNGTYTMVLLAITS